MDTEQPERTRAEKRALTTRCLELRQIFLCTSGSHRHLGELAGIAVAMGCYEAMQAAVHVWEHMNDATREREQRRYERSLTPEARTAEMTTKNLESIV